MQEVKPGPSRMWYALVVGMLAVLVAVDLLLPLTISEEQLMIGGALLAGAAALCFL